MFFFAFMCAAWIICAVWAQNPNILNKKQKNNKNKWKKKKTKIGWNWIWYWVNNVAHNFCTYVLYVCVAIESKNSENCIVGTEQQFSSTQTKKAQTVDCTCTDTYIHLLLFSLKIYCFLFVSLPDYCAQKINTYTSPTTTTTKTKNIK